MTTFAYREVVAAKRTLPVMTTHATKRTLRRVMIKRLRCCYFISAYAMTIIATAIVLCVTEAKSERARCLAWARVTTGFMTHTTRRDVAIAGLRLRTVTLKTGGVRVEADWDRQRHAAASWSMAVRTRDSTVTRMVEFHVEAG
jgi:hypothetical protein